MYVVLDSNIIIADYYLRGRHFRDLSHYLKVTGSQLVVPDIVVSEVAKHMELQCREALSAINKPAEKLERVAGSELIDLNALRQKARDQIEQYQEYLAKRLEEMNLVELDYGDIDREELIDKVVNRKKPFKKSGAGVGDHLIWEAVKQCLTMEDGDTAFVTRNSMDFSVNAEDGKHLLNEYLDTEVSSLRGKLSYYIDLQGFLSDQMDTPGELDAEAIMNFPGYQDLSICLREYATAASSANHPLYIFKPRSIEVNIGAIELESFYGMPEEDGRTPLILRYSVPVDFEIGGDRYGDEVINMLDSSSRIIGKGKLILDLHAVLTDAGIAFQEVLDARFSDLDLRTEYSPVYSAVSPSSIIDASIFSGSVSLGAGFPQHISVSPLSFPSGSAVFASDYSHNIGPGGDKTFIAHPFGQSLEDGGGSSDTSSGSTVPSEGRDDKGGSEQP